MYNSKPNKQQTKSQRCKWLYLDIEGVFFKSNQTNRKPKAKGASDYM